MGKHFITRAVIAAVLVLAFINPVMLTSAATSESGYSTIAVIDAALDDYEEWREWPSRLNEAVFSSGLAAVKINGKYGYIDLSGKLVIPAQFSWAGGFKGDYALISDGSRVDTAYGLIDRKGNIVLPVEYGLISEYNGSYFNEYGFAIASTVMYRGGSGGLYGTVDKNNKTIIPFEYGSISQFTDGTAIASDVTWSGQYLGGEVGGSYAVIDTEGKILQTIESDYWEFANGYAITNKFNFDENKHYYGLIDENYNLILPCEYERIQQLCESYFILKKDGVSSVTDINTGKIPVTSKDDYIFAGESFDAETGLLTVNKGEPSYNAEEKYDPSKAKYGAVNLKGDVIIPFEYEVMQRFSEGLSAAQKNGKWGFIDINNKTVIPFNYDYAYRFINGTAVVAKNNYEIIIDKNNKELYRTDMHLNSVENRGVDEHGSYTAGEYTTEFLRLSKYDKSRSFEGIIDRNGKTIVPVEYLQILSVENKYFICSNSYASKDGSSYTVYSVYDRLGNKHKNNYLSAQYVKNHDMFIVSDTMSDGRRGFGIVDGKGNIIVPLEYEINYCLSNYYYDVYVNPVNVSRNLKTGKFGYISDSGEFIIPPVFDEACGVNDQGCAIVKEGGKWKIIRINAAIPPNKTGDVIGNILHTDITAYINDKPIPTMNADNKTMVKVEDLSCYGFLVVWDSASRTLRVQREFGKTFSPLSVKPEAKPSGAFMCNYCCTDIKTYLSGEEAAGYNINGTTMIDIELLSKYGSVEWNGQKREIRLYLD